MDVLQRSRSRRLGWQLVLVVALGAALGGGPARALNEGLPPPPRRLDRQTPLAAAQGFAQAAYAGDYARAAHYLDLDFISPAEQPTEGPRLARRLRFVLDRKLWLDFSTLSREPAGDPAQPGVVELGVIPEDRGQQPIRLNRVPGPGGELVWVFSEATVKAVDRLYDVHGPPLGERLPGAFFRPWALGLEVWQWLGLLLTLVGATLGALLLERGLLAGARRLTQRTSVRWDDVVVEAARGPFKLLPWAALVALGTRTLLLSPDVQRGFDLVARSALIVSVAWFLLRLSRRAARGLQQQVGAEDGGGDVRLRSLRTQVAVLRRVLEVAICLIAAALLLMQFETVRNVGLSLLASAGIAGLALGFAAQKSLATLLAGIQLSITQPIRIGDTVIVEGQFGTIEEINITFVVVRTWDLRRLVVPMNYFLDRPFENWSKGGGQLLGPVLLQVDYGADVDALRAELARIVREEGARWWDGQVARLLVTDASDRTQTVRALVSARNPDDLFELRCLVRERLIAFLRRNPIWLPATRTQALPALEVGVQAQAVEVEVEPPQERPGVPRA